VRTVEAGGVAFAVREWGEAGSPALLFWHGAGDGSHQFEQPGRVLSEEYGLFVVAPDAPGHGATPALPPEEYLPSRLASLAAALLDALAIERTAFAGFSWGGSIGCRFASAFPERTGALVLIEGGHVDFRDVPGFEPPASLDEAVAEHGRDGALRWGSVQEPAADTYPALAASGVPLLLVTGGFRSLPFDPAARLRERVPQAEVRTVEAQTHDLVAHDPRNLARLVGDWLV
jgi:pimeloyl-ACP methyl ester carboxylesterase